MTKSFRNKIFLFFLLAAPVLAQSPEGLFLSLSPGLRIPLGGFADSHDPAAGLDISFSYADSGRMPVLYYLRAGYQHFGGRQSFMLSNDESSLSTSIFSFSPGISIFLKPITAEHLILCPVIEAGGSIALLRSLHQYKPDRWRPDFEDDRARLGFHLGAGMSLFLVDLMARYNYLKDNQYFSLDLDFRIPLYVAI